MHILITAEVAIPLPSTQNSFKNNFKLAIINCQSIVNKYINLQALITLEEIDLILAAESHLDHTIANSEVFSLNFNVYRKDSNRHRGSVSS